MRTKTKTHRILIVEDHPVVRQGLQSIIDGEDDLEACCAASSVQEALDQVSKDKPDLVLSDLGLPGRNGLELIKDLKSLHPDLPVLVISMHDELIYAERILRAGGRGYIMKEAPFEMILGAIQTILKGGIFVSKQVTNHFLERMSGKSGQATSFPLQRLTDRELEVFDLIGQGKGNQEIARLLSISPRTVDAHRTHIREKLELASSNELMRHAVRWTESSLLE